jgi:hypothetical protein
MSDGAWKVRYLVPRVEVPGTDPFSAGSYSEVSSSTSATIVAAASAET